MSHARRKKGAVSVRGPWLALPLRFLASRACAELSPVALKMLIDLCAQLGPNARGNGDLSAAPSVLAPRGWTGNGSRMAALQELIDADLLVVTRRGDRKKCALYAVALYPLDCDFAKLDVGPGAYSTIDWERDDRAERPTLERPARRGTARGQARPENAISGPVAGKPPADIDPQRDNPQADPTAYVPAVGKQPPVSAV